jgi:hypothetical protein
VRFLVTLLALVAVALPVTGAAGAGAGSGLYGLVRRGPVTPVCREGVPCYKPAAALVLTFVAQDGTQLRVTSRANGKYRLALPVGPYSVRVGSSSAAHFGRFGSRLKPALVTVTAGFTRQNFVIDTGIR